MVAKKNLILYQASGVRYINQAWYSIASLINVYKGKLPKNLYIIVYTDNISAFDSIKSLIPNFEAIFLTAEKSREWAGVKNYIFRFKPKLIEDALLRYPGNAIYVDTDTAFIARLEKLFNRVRKGGLLLHTREWMLSHGLKQWGLDVITQPRNVTMINGQRFTITDSSYMWNAGVVGISKENELLIYEVLNLLDLLISDGPHYLSEQLTWSVMFDHRGKLYDAKTQVYHYWHDKDLMDKHIAELLDVSKRDFNSFLSLVNPMMFVSNSFKDRVSNKVKSIVSVFRTR